MCSRPAARRIAFVRTEGDVVSFLSKVVRWKIAIDAFATRLKWRRDTAGQKGALGQSKAQAQIRGPGASDILTRAADSQPILSVAIPRAVAHGRVCAPD